MADQVNGGRDLLGSRIRGLRKAQALTLAQLGTATGLSHAFLSQVEHGRSRPSMPSLARIAEALGTTTSELLAGPPPTRPRVVHRGSAPEIGDRPGSGEARSVSISEPGHLIQAVEVVGAFDWLEPRAHPGLETVYAVHGVVEIDVAGRVYTLGTGDALTFDPLVVHTYRTVGEETCFLCLIADAGGVAFDLERAVQTRRLVTASPGT